MALTLDQFDTVALTGIIRLRPPKWSLFSTFFKPQAPSETDIFELHTKAYQYGVLPPIGEYSAGTLMQPQGWEISQVKAPRFRTKRLFRAADVLMKRQIGSSPYDLESDPVIRLVAEDMDAHRMEHDRMIEIMCAQAATEGKVTLYDLDNGAAKAAFTIDYARPASHTISVAKADQWNAEGADLFEQIDAASTLIQEDADGLPATDLIMGATAFAAFRNHPDVVDIMDNRHIDAGGALSFRVAQPNKGTWNGLRIWTYSGTYKDIDGTVKHFIDPDDAVLLARDAESVIEYGRPVDLDCAGATTYFAKQYRQDDPSGVFTVAESRPLPVTRHAGWAVRFDSVTGR